VGLKPLARKSLAPREVSEKLTVMVWLAQGPGVPVRRSVEAAA
jgi:hypothetical protein